MAGWRRNLALFVAARPGTALAATALAVAPALGLAAALAAGDAAAAAAAWGLAAAASALVRPRGQRLWALAAPADALLLGLTLGLAQVDRARGRRATWRGRAVALGGDTGGETAEKKRP